MDLRRTTTRMITPRQTEVLQLLANGKGNKEIAEHLWLTVDTVKHHQKEARYNLLANTNAQAVAIAVRKGLIT